MPRKSSREGAGRDLESASLIGVCSALGSELWFDELFSAADEEEEDRDEAREARAVAAHLVPNAEPGGRRDLEDRHQDARAANR